MKKRIFENGIYYVLVGDYYVPELSLPDETRSIGRWGRLHREYLRMTNPGIFNDLILTGKLWTYLADLNSAYSADEGARGYYRTAQGKESNGMGWSDEQHSQSCRGNCKI